MRLVLAACVLLPALAWADEPVPSEVPTGGAGVDCPPGNRVCGSGPDRHNDCSGRVR